MSLYTVQSHPIWEFGSKVSAYKIELLLKLLESTQLPTPRDAYKKLNQMRKQQIHICVSCPSHRLALEHVLIEWNGSLNHLNYFLFFRFFTK